MTAADMLNLFNRLTGRPAADAITDAVKYQWLAEAQNEVISEIAAIAPQTLYQKVGTSALPQLVTVDQNVFTFGLDASNQPIVPFGRTQIYRKLSDVPDLPLRPDWDYIDEGSQIRLPRNRKYSGSLWWRGVVFPAAIALGQDPALIPTQANELTAIRAARNFAESGNLRNPALADRMRIRWKERFPYWALVWRQQFARGGALTAWSLKDTVTPLL